jgi:hypothetical protein
MEKTEIDKAAFEYAMHASNAPDKETPDWIITDFKAGAKWESEHGESAKLLHAVCWSRNYIPIKLRRKILEHLKIPF